MTKLDYTLKTTEERLALVNKILSDTPQDNLRQQYLTYMADYILFINDREQTKKERQEEKPITTKNREKTINKRQVSFEEIVSSLENGEDGLYAMINNDKNQILDPKDKINKNDEETIPGLKEQLEQIEILQQRFNQSTGIDKYNYKKQIIETWQQIYILKAAAKSGCARGRASNQIKTMAHANLNEEITLDSNLLPHSNCMISLFNPAHVSFLLCYYAQLKEECADDLTSDMHWLLIDLEDIVERTFENDPFLYDLLIYKIDGLTNEEIQEKMINEYNVEHTEQYYSTLWRKRIPKLIVEQAQKEWVEWHYMNHVRADWIKCGKCGEYKLAHPLFFSSNSNTRGYYSICKDCRNGK